MKEAYGFVYETINLINGMKYIGKCIYSRQNNWRTYLGSGLYLKRAIRKYGKENFERRILAIAYSDEQLNSLEELFIRKFDAVNSPIYYNVKYTSIGGDVFTNNPNKEVLRRFRKVQMSGVGNHQYGKAKSEIMISAVQQANSKPIEIDGVVYGSAAEASRVLGCKQTAIMYRLDSPNFPNYKRLDSKTNRKRKSRNKPIKCEIDGLIYDSLAIASQCLGLSKTCIRRRLLSDNFPNCKIIPTPDN
jgi:group I intron endonuclease